MAKVKDTPLLLLGQPEGFITPVKAVCSAAACLGAAAGCVVFATGAALRWCCSLVFPKTREGSEVFLGLKWFIQAAFIST